MSFVSNWFFSKKKILCKINNNKIKLHHNPEQAVQGQILLITDTWESMGMKKIVMC